MLQLFFIVIIAALAGIGLGWFFSREDKL